MSETSEGHQSPEQIQEDRGFRVGDKVLNPGHNWTGEIQRFGKMEGRSTAVVKIIKDGESYEVEEFLTSLRNLTEREDQ